MNGWCKNSTSLESTPVIFHWMQAVVLCADNLATFWAWGLHPGFIVTHLCSMSALIILGRGRSEMETLPKQGTTNAWCVRHSPLGEMRLWHTFSFQMRLRLAEAFQYGGTEKGAGPTALDSDQCSFFTQAQSTWWFSPAWPVCPYKAFSVIKMWVRWVVIIL